MRAICRISISFVFLIGALLVQSASADPFADVIVSDAPTNEGPIFSPGVVTVDILNADERLEIEYVEEEYFVEGSSDVYQYGTPPESGELILRNDVPTDYKTRIIIRRPVDPAEASTALVVEWWNSTAGFDTAPVWDASAEHFARKGWMYVGISNANQVFGFLNGGCALLVGVTPPRCGTRYDGLSLEEDGVAYEMVSQIVNMLKGDTDQNPLGDFRIKRVYHAGQSQQAGTVNTYAREFHEPSLAHGYFIQAGGGSGRILSTDSPNFAFGDPRGLPPTDMSVPVIRVQTETEVDIFGVIFNRQEDTPTFRYYEIAGAGHLTVHEDVEIIPAGFFGPFPITIQDLCLDEINSIVDGPVYGKYVYNAMWKNLNRQAKKPSRRMPHGDLIELTPDFDIARDADGNALGGIRLPAMNVPTGSHFRPTNIPKAACGGGVFPPNCNPIGSLGVLACRLAASTIKFDDNELIDRYEGKSFYVDLVSQEARRLRKAGFLTRQDRYELIDRAIDEALGWEDSR